MFKSLKIYLDLRIALEDILAKLIDLGYKRQELVMQEGDFSRRGGIIDIFPFTFELPVRIEMDSDKIISIRSFNYETGESIWAHKIAIILPVRRSRTYKSTPFKEEFPLSGFVDLNIGDYVVHNLYGIGRFSGIQKLNIKDKQKDHLVIEYDNKEKLFVPIDQMHLVQKYIAFHVRRPKLHKLGGREWQGIKMRTKKGIQKLAWELLSLQAMRLSVKGHSYSPDTDWQKEFEDGFIYEETPDQMRATQEVKKDLESQGPMDRLLCGDVGYGKTEVAMRAAFKAVMDNKQVAYLVPTTILAEQHFQNFGARLKNFPINLELLCRFKSDSEQKKIVENLAKGVTDIVIGTHRLLSDDISFKDLGLLIIDEEQRFGVKDKEKLKRLKVSTDILTLTATPIPRTLYMGLMGARDLSLINTPPQNRLPIKTVVVEYDEDLIRQAIVKEINRKGQVFFLHNRVHDIEKVKTRLEKILSDSVRLGIAHGQMPSSLLEKVMCDFLEAKIDCLICTMIIESGIDIPNANTIIVDEANSFGLSDLHQLRGRVGRFNKLAFAYFMIPKHGVLDKDAKQRLDAIQEYSYLGSGFKIAMEDLEIRGAGNLLGEQQHGFIQAVGFDLYCRLLKESVDNFKTVLKND